MCTLKALHQSNAFYIIGDNMEYKKIKEGIFINRPNRFIAEVEVDGKTEICHVKNTGRCKELLIPGTKVFLEETDNINRKTKYDLISVFKGNNLINMDSNAPNKVVYEWLKTGKLFGNITFIKAESKYKNSRFDFYVETDEKKIFIEVKGVTLEENGIASFPDAPTMRGIKHLQELVSAKNDGFDAYVIFVVQMKGCSSFTPNRKTHPEFAEQLKIADKHGVKIICVDCIVTEKELAINEYIKVNL